MRDFERSQQKKGTRHIAFSLPVLAAVGIAAIFMLVGTWHIYQKEQLTRGNLEKVTGVYNELQKREKDLSASVDSLQTTFGIESEIRGKFGFVKEGEEMVVLVDEPNKKSENGEVPKKKSFWQKLKDIF